MIKSFRFRVIFLLLLAIIGALVFPLTLHADSTIYSQQEGGFNFIPVSNPDTGDTSNIQIFNFDHPEYLKKGVLKSITLKIQIVDQAFIDANEGFVLRVTRAGDFNQCSSTNAPSGGEYTLGESFIFVFQFDSACTSNWFNFGEGQKLYSWGVGGGRASGYRLAYDETSNHFWQEIKIEGNEIVLPPEEPEPSEPVIYNQKIFSGFVPVLNPESGDGANIQLFNSSKPQYEPKGVLNSIILNLRIDDQAMINDETGFSLSVVRAGDFHSCSSVNAVSGKGHIVGEPFRFEFLFDLSCTKLYFDFDKGDRLYSWGRWLGVSFGYSLAYDSSSGNFWQVITAQNGLVDGTAPVHTPVLIIPGIMGTEMRSGNELVWPDITRTLLSPSDDFMDSLAYGIGGTTSSSNIQPGNVVRRFGPSGPGLDYTDSLIVALQSNGYELDKDLFLFPYDWRRDIREVADTDMGAAIDRILSKSGSSKINVIAHSQGGLVIKSLLYDKPQYQSKIDTVIFVGTPNLGAPQAAKTLLYGDSMGLRFLQFGLNPLEIKKLTLNMPSVYELLPSLKYFDFVPGYIADSEFWDYVTTRYALSDAGLSSSLVRNAEQFHEESFDSFDWSISGMHVINISGCETPTVMTIGRWPDGTLRLFYGAGDGTVPVASAAYAPGALLYYVIDSNLEHSMMLSDSGIQKLLMNIVSHSTDPFSAPIVTDPTLCNFGGSQVEIHGEAAELSIINAEGSPVTEAPGIALDKIGGDQFAFIPSGSNYSARILGLKPGKVDIRTSEVVGGSVVGSRFYPGVEVVKDEKVDPNNVPPNSSVISVMDETGDTSAPAAVVVPAVAPVVLSPDTAILLSYKSPGLAFQDVVSPPELSVNKPLVRQGMVKNSTSDLSKPLQSRHRTIAAPSKIKRLVFLPGKKIQKIYTPLTVKLLFLLLFMLLCVGVYCLMKKGK